MFKVKDLLEATGGKLKQGSLSAKVKTVGADSRTIKKTDAFIAICGEKFDGHQFIKDALQKGVKVIVVSRPVQCPAHISVIEVTDTTKALGLIAAWHRARFLIPVIAVTGSAGKTTTKELITAVLGRKYKVLKNVKTENNQFGVSQTLLRLNESHQAVVLETGTNHRGEILWLAEIIKPTVVVFTNVGESHLEGLGSPQGVYEEKISLLKYLSSKGAVIFNADDQYLSAISRVKISGKKITYSCDKVSAYQAKNVTVDRKNQIQFRFNRRKFILKSPARHNVYNALAAIACAEYLKVNGVQVQKVLQSFKFSSGRMEIRKSDGMWVINDTYNANPVSFRSAVRTLHEFQGAKRRILICGDMLELGDQSKALHRNLGELIARSAINYVLTIGEHVHEMAQGLKSLNHKVKVLNFNSLAEMENYLKGFIQPKDVVLLKASRRIKLEKLVEFLLRANSKPSMNRKNRMEQLCFTI
jgi:UDP-N-acetylmuramoyl-tripeptide--D-alanyl-D-alanine ligase